MDENTALEGLEDAFQEEPEPSNGESEQGVEGKDPESKKAPGPIPYTRFKQVNDKVHELETSLQEREEELNERATALAKLTSVLEAKERDATYVQQIRDLYRSGDEEWAPVLEQLEKRLAGVEEEVESGEETEEEGENRTRQILKDTTEKLEDAILDQRADLIIARADAFAEQMLDQLPEEYTANDKRRIAHYLTEAVDWESVEGSKDWQKSLEAELPKAFDYVLNTIYGEPEGMVAQRVMEELEARGQTKAPEPTAEEKLDGLLSRDWGKFTKDESAKVFKPEVSDAEFSRAMGQALRAARIASENVKKG